MGIIKADDFEKINQNKLTIEELRQQQKSVKHYTDSQIDIRQKMAEAEQAVAQSLSEEITLLTNRLQLAQKSCKLAEQEVVRMKAVMAANREVLELKTQLTDEKNYTATLAAQYAELEKNLVAERQARTKSVQEHSELQSRYAAIQEQGRQQQQSITTAEQHITALTEQLTIAKQDTELRAATLEREHAAYTQALEEIVGLNDAAVVTANKMTALQKDLLRYETDIAELRSTLPKETVRNEQLMTEKAQAQYLLEKQKRAETDLQSQLKRSKDTESGVSKNVQALQAKIVALEQAREKAVGEINRVIGALRTEQEKNIKFENDFQRAAVEFKTLKEELSHAKDTIIILKSQVKIAEREALHDGLQVIEVPVQA